MARVEEMADSTMGDLKSKYSAVQSQLAEITEKREYIFGQKGSSLGLLQDYFSSILTGDLQNAR